VTPTLAKYQLLGRLATGGMAHVWLARSMGPAGFQKLVVLKTILPHLAEDPRWVDMFFHEARVAALLNHPNCVQIFDLGEDNGTPYIAMEFIDGFALSRVLYRLRQRQQRIPPPIVARVVMDAASGLDYAHRLRDQDGTPLGLIHRDVSPDNILVSFAGQSKMVDFGIAKVAQKTTTAATRVGEIKGKMGYMSPEYLRAKPFDARADIFALGVVLYRSLAGRKPFEGEGDAQIITAICDPAPPVSLRKRNPAVSESLEAVVMKALEKDPDRRFENAREMRTALERVQPRPVDSEGVAAFMDKLWPVDDAERAAVQGTVAGKAPRPSMSVLRAVPDDIVKSTPSGHVSVAATSTRSTRPPRRPRYVLLAAGSVFVVGLGFGLLFKHGTLGFEAPAPVAVPLEPVAKPDTKPVAKPEVKPDPKPDPKPDEQPVKTAAADAPAAPIQPDPPAADPVKTLSPPVAHPTPPAKSDANARAAPKEPRGATGKLEINAVPGFEVWFNGKALGETPGTFELPLGKQAIDLVHAGLNVERKMTVSVPGKVQIKLEEASLDIRCAPWATVKLDGKSLGTTPVPIQNVLEGRHVIELENSELKKSKRIVTTLKAGERSVVRESFE
jgi:serine/threonine-protein kinase